MIHRTVTHRKEEAIQVSFQTCESLVAKASVAERAAVVLKAVLEWKSPPPDSTQGIRASDQPWEPSAAGAGGPEELLATPVPERLCS